MVKTAVAVDQMQTITQISVIPTMPTIRDIPHPTLELAQNQIATITPIR